MDSSIPPSIDTQGYASPLRADAQGYTFLLIDPGSLNRYAQLFVPPPNFPEQPENNKARVFVIEGAQGSGKRIAAINFAMTLAKDTLPIFMYQTKNIPLYDLNILLTENTFPGKGIFIIPNIHKHNLDPNALTQENVTSYTSAMHNATNTIDAYLILTLDEAYSVNLNIGVPRYKTAGLDLDRVIDSHGRVDLKFDRYDSPLAAVLKTKQDELKRKLHTPKKISKLFEILKGNPPDTGQEATTIELLIGDLSEDSTSQRWFRDLAMNTKVFIMLMALLLDNNYELTRFEAEELYFAFVQKARQKPGMDAESVFIDPRRIGFDDLVLSAKMSFQNNQLSFNREDLLNDVLRDQIPNYQSLLWILAEMLADHLPSASSLSPQSGLIELLVNPDAPMLSFSNARQVLANLVGTVGVLRERRLFDLLDRMRRRDTQHNDQNIIGYVLQPLAHQPKHHSFLLRALHQWLAKDEEGKKVGQYDPNSFITATSAIAIIYTEVSTIGTAQTRQKLRQMIVDMAGAIGEFDAYFDQIEAEAMAAVEQQIFQFRAEKGEKALTDGDIKTMREAVLVAVAKNSLFNAEYATIILLLALIQISETHPEDVVQVINEWLKNGLSQVEVDDFEMEDDVDIEHMLRIEDALALNEEQLRIIRTQKKGQTHTERQRQLKKRRIILQNMQWHIGMLSAVLFFEADNAQSDIDDESDDDASDSSPTVSAEVQKKPVTSNVSASSDALKETSQANPPPSVAVSADSGESDVAEQTSEETPTTTEKAARPTETNGGSETSSAEEPPPAKPEISGLRQPQTKTNSLAIKRNKFPLLDLLPNLLASAEITFSPSSFVKNSNYSGWFLGITSSFVNSCA